MDPRIAIVRNKVDGRELLMGGTLRSAVLNAYVRYELQDVDETDPEGRYGDLVTVDEPGRAVLGNWEAVWDA